VRSRRLVWGLCFGLATFSWFTAHTLSYRLAAPHGSEHVGLLEQSGHGYLDHLRGLLVLCLVLVIAAVAGSVADGRKGRASPRLSIKFFGFLPPVAFIVQEHLERLVYSGNFPLYAVTEQTFAIGLLLQIPFALFALVLAWTLLALGTAIGRASGAPPVFELCRLPCLRAPASRADAPRIAALALGHGQRAPPPLSLTR
jgi:hypothetical protein